MSRIQVFGLFVLLALSVCAREVAASSITLNSYPELANKEFSIEAGLEVLAEGQLNGDSQTVEIDSLLGDDATRIPAKVSVDEHNEFAIDVNLFKCDAGCRWQVALVKFVNPDSQAVQKICMNDESTIDGIYERYFFCRKTFKGHLAAKGTCWPEAMQALRGWFDAAYRLHTKTLKEGTAFFARDEEAEAYVKDSILACRDFERSVRTAGYFKGMFVELDKATLQATQKVDRLLKKGDTDTARRWAETLVGEVGSDRSIRGSISADEVRYVEAILNRALQSDPPFVLP